ncbi:uncharacterized protein PITG_15537 [Phytophthora infestans T30-4]|uniref:RING-type domain-containing protein n=1 Tax=Phytophthora infestans (strain T30-4) TaxID=403677 RepID=D0NT96_PHYIT|nr:uncharacterized protein PITG_15537 [Phytophthora infestans T30-4]EEY64764.1 conserved hypothetical protein [Phytophthora infestans T30-4]|eukprot:XP_002897691.1 conserved hypothetical protein [Phytophthora infestans T30-4]
MGHLNLDMTTCANKNVSLVKRNNTLYELQLTYKPDKGRKPASWTVSRTFDEYRALQRRLVKALKPGHKCNAECKWLVNVIKNHSPKASLFCKNCPSTVESRRLSLLRLVSTVKTSLINHGNIGCVVLRDQVSKELSTFLLADCKDLTDEITSSMVSLTSDEENLVLDFELDDDFADFECDLCGLSLDALEEIATSTSPHCTTATFDCGHQYHDMCVLLALGEEVKCPLCR